MSEPNTSGNGSAGTVTAGRSLFTKSRIAAAAIGLGGMIFGSIVGIAVQKGVQSTGMLGPSVESLIAEQASNFNDVNQRLDALKGMSDDKEVQAGLAELGKLMARQGELAKQANAEIAHLGAQVSTMREEQLAQSGFAGGADFWLKVGESVNVGDRKQVFGLTGFRGTFADINLSGARKRVVIGDSIPVSSDETGCTIFYKQATPRPDGRIGFDITCG